MSNGTRSEYVQSRAITNNRQRTPGACQGVACVVSGSDLVGNSGNNKLTGLGGNDLLNGGARNDILTRASARTP